MGQQCAAGGQSDLEGHDYLEPILDHLDLPQQHSVQLLPLRLVLRAEGSVLAVED